MRGRVQLVIKVLNSVRLLPLVSYVLVRNVEAAEQAEQLLAGQNTVKGCLLEARITSWLTDMFWPCLNMEI